MNNLQAVQVSQALDKLTHYYPYFLLPESASLMDQSVKVERIRILKNHVDLRRRLDSLMVLDAVVAIQLTGDFHFGQDLLIVFSIEALQVENLACEDLLG